MPLLRLPSINSMLPDFFVKFPSSHLVNEKKVAALLMDKRYMNVFFHRKEVAPMLPFGLLFSILFFSRDTKHFSREPYRKVFFYLKQDVLIHKQTKSIFILQMLVSARAIRDEISLLCPP